MKLTACFGPVSYTHLDVYKRQKMLVWKNQTGDDWFLVNLDDPEIVKRCAELPCRRVTFSLDQPADVCVKQDQVWLFDQPLFALSDLHLPGRHNLQNAMVAAAMAVKLGVDADQIREGIRAFKGVEHRIEFVAEIRGARYYNDSKGTNVDATTVALKAFELSLIHILDAQGGQRLLESQRSAGQDRRLRQGRFPEYSAGDIGQQADGNRGRAAGIDVSSFTNRCV